jgi:lipid II:glycine glycyltransferase (peptidoglycan interpeptide bridge formation enzyme)
MWERKGYFYPRPWLNDLARKHLLHYYFDKVNRYISRTVTIFKLDFPSLSVMIY